MKKIYMLAACLILFGSLIGQNADVSQIKEQIKARMAGNLKSGSSAQGPLVPFYNLIDPIGDVSINNQVAVQLSRTALFQDSTIKYGPGSPFDYQTNIQSIFRGVVLDPKSKSLDIDGLNSTPICSSADTFNIESIDVIGAYTMVQDTALVKDTLYMWVVWGVPSSSLTPLNPEFQSRFPNNVGQPAFRSTAFPYVLDTKVSGASTTTPGNIVKPTAPASNVALIKRVLTVSDSIEPTNSNFKIINMNITDFYPGGISIPANNVVSCFYTFATGSPYGPTDVTYVSPAATGVAQTVNGYAAAIYVSPGVPDQVDANGWNMGLAYDKYQRHKFWATYSGPNIPLGALSYLDNEVTGDLQFAPWIYFTISGTTTVAAGIDESYSNFSLGQNEPNPFENQSLINYQLKKSAKNVSFEIYNVAGVKVYEKAERNLIAGKYSVDMKDINFSSGMYFYSLTVDGNKATKKMMVTK